MAKKSYIGVDGKAREVKKWYVGAEDGTARKVKKGYVGVGGVARPFIGGGDTLEYYGIINSLSTYRTNAGAASIGDYALFAGGQDSSGKYQKVVDVCDSSLTVSTATDMSVSRISTCGCSNEKYAIFAGGRYKGVATYDSNHVDAYDESLVRVVPSKMTGAKNNATGASNKAYVLFAGGGYSAVYAYDTSLVMTSVGDLQYKMYEGGGATSGNYAIFAGGNSTYVNAYDQSLVRTTISSPNNLDNPIKRLKGASVREFAIFAGGYYYTSSNKPVTNENVFVYNSSLVKTYASGLRRTSITGCGVSSSEYAVFAGGKTTTSSTSAIYDVTAYNSSLVRTFPTELPQTSVSVGTSVGNFILFEKSYDLFSMIVYQVV